MQGLSWDTYMQYTGLTLDKMMEQVRPQAEDRIKSRIVLEAVAKAEGIEVTDDDIDAYLKNAYDTASTTAYSSYEDFRATIKVVREQ